MTRPSTPEGFTLIELIIVIVITGIIAAVVSPIVSNQFQAYSDSSRRATLVQEAQSVMQQLERDLYYAVPNSTLVSEDDDEFELLVLARSTDSKKLPSARYDEGQFGDGSFGVDDQWDVFGCFTTDGDNLRIVVGSRDPVETLGRYDDPTSPDGPTFSEFTVDPEPDCDDDSPQGSVVMDAEHDFQDTSSYNRLYFTDGKVTYSCDDSGLSRAQDYGGVADDAVPVSNQVDTCEFERLIGGTYEPPSLLVSITLGDADNEQITLTRSFQLVNAP